MEKSTAGTIGLHPLAVDDELGNGAFAYVLKHQVGCARSYLDVDFFVGYVVGIKKTLGFPAIAAPGRSINSQIHRHILWDPLLLVVVDGKTAIDNVGAASDVGRFV